MADLEKLFHQVTENFKTLSRRIRRLEKAADEIGITGIRIREVDAVPTLSGIHTLEFPNGTVSGIAQGIARVTSSTGLTVTEIDGTPTFSGISTLEFPNSTVTNPSDGVARVIAGGGITVTDQFSFPVREGQTTLVFTDAIIEEGADPTTSIITISGGGSSGGGLVVNLYGTTDQVIFRSPVWPYSLGTPNVYGAGSGTITFNFNGVNNPTFPITFDDSGDALAITLTGGSNTAPTPVVIVIPAVTL